MPKIKITRELTDEESAAVDEAQARAGSLNLGCVLELLAVAAVLALAWALLSGGLS